jgi:hypothetical protein
MNKRIEEWMNFCIDWLLEEYHESDGSLCFSKFVEKKYKERGVK